MTTNEATRVARIELQDALVDEEGSITVAPYRCIMFLRVPGGAWLVGDALTPDAVERALQAIYGATWRDGNVDGSFFRVLEITSALLDAEEERTRPWL